MLLALALSLRPRSVAMVRSESRILKASFTFPRRLFGFGSDGSIRE